MILINMIKGARSGHNYVSTTVIRGGEGEVVIGRGMPCVFLGFFFNPKHTPRHDPNGTCASPQHTITPLPQRLKSPAFIATFKLQSPADPQSSSLPSPPVPPSTESRSPPTLNVSFNRAANTTTPQNVQYGRRQDGTSWGTNAAKKDYWCLAIEKLKEEDLSVADQTAGSSKPLQTRAMQTLPCSCYIRQSRVNRPSRLRGGR